MSESEKPAYPVAANYVQTGLTKRQWYAGMALQGLCANPKYAGSTYEDMVERSHKYAGAMLAQEEKEKSKGIRLTAPKPGDIVTVKIKRKPREEISYRINPFGETADEADSPQHYRMTDIWRVLTINAGQVVVENITGYNIGEREVWPVDLHEWFEASELFEAMKGRKKCS